MTCLFCKIVKGEIPCSKVWENDAILAFRDINPQAPVHVLIIPKIHINNLLEFNPTNGKLLEEIFSAIQYVADLCQIDQTGFRIVTNNGHDGGQEISHLHFHLLGGRHMSWPPG